MADPPRLSVILPSFRQPDQAAAAVGRVRAALAPELVDDALEVIVVDDGSGDETVVRAEAAGADLVITHPENRGKGAAVRSGAARAGGRTVAFTDVDLAFDPSQLLVLLKAVEAGHDLVVGNRRHPDAVTLVPARRLREVGGRLISLLARIVLLGRHRDTQCGLKGFRAEVAPMILGEGLIDGFAFDIELLYLADRHQLDVVEIPVHVAHSEVSSVRPGRDGLLVIRDLFRIRLNAARGRYSSLH